MARVKVRLNSPGMASLLKDAGIRADLTARAEKVAAAARSNAPLDTGEYRSSIFVSQATTDRVAVRVGSSAPHGLIVESRTGNLARALDGAVGGTEKVRYTTKAGKTRWASQAQVDNWTRGSR